MQPERSPRPISPGPAPARPGDPPESRAGIGALVLPIVFFLAIFGAPPSIALAEPLDIVVEVTSSRGLEMNAPVRSGETMIGRVTRVGFGENDSVEIAARIDPRHRNTVRAESTFVIVSAPGAAPHLALFVLDPASPPAADGARFQGAASIAEVWLRRGRISSEELSRALEKGLEKFRDDLEALRQSPEWEKFRDELASLAARLQSAGEELGRLLEQQLPKLRRELDEMQRRYQEELERRRDEREHDET